VKLYIAGIFSYAAFYLLVLIFREKVIDHLVLIGIIKGIAMGLYWFGYHILTIDYTEHGKRDSFYSTTSVISGSASMAGPLIAGLIIKTSQALSGYYMVFAMTSFLLLVAAVMITPLKSTPIKKPYKIEDLIFTKNKKWRNTMIAYLFLSGKDAIMMFMLAVLVVRATGSEFTFGGFATLVSGMAILTAFLMGRFSRPGIRKYLVLSGAALSFLASLLLVYKISFPTLIIYGLIGAVADCLVRIPFSAYSMDLITLDASVNERKMEYIAARDVPIAAGRILTLVLFLILLKNMDLNAIKVIMPLISSFLFVVYWAMYK
jgi:YQGE family putative transporter